MTSEEEKNIETQNIVTKETLEADQKKQTDDQDDENKKNNDEEMESLRDHELNNNGDDTTSIPLKKVDDFLARWQHVSSSEKIFFVQQLGVMIKSGISLAKALEILAKQTSNKHMQQIILKVHEQTLKGTTLATALKPYKKIFGELFINMVEAGEKSGTLEEVLKQIFLQLKKNHKLMSKIRGALTYPAIILLAMGSIGTGVMIFVVPKFISIFEQVNVELPLMTQILIAVSNYISTNGYMVVIIILVAVAVWIQFMRTAIGKKTFHFTILKIPIISGIIKKINLARFARTMSSLLKTDIKIMDSFHITANTLNNVYYKKSLMEAAEQIEKGKEIHTVLAQYPNLYTNVIIQMIAIGEESGELDNILFEIADFYEEEVQQIMDTLPTIIEPLIILLLAVVIGGMAIAIIMPMYSLTNAF